MVDLAAGVVGVVGVWVSGVGATGVVSSPDTVGTGVLDVVVARDAGTVGLGEAATDSFPPGALVRSSAAARSATLIWPASSRETERATPALVVPAWFTTIAAAEFNVLGATDESALVVGGGVLSSAWIDSGFLESVTRALARSRARLVSSSRAKSDAPRALSARLRSARVDASEVVRAFADVVFEVENASTDSVME